MLIRNAYSWSLKWTCHKSAAYTGFFISSPPCDQFTTLPRHYPVAGRNFHASWFHPLIHPYRSAIEKQSLALSSSFPFLPSCFGVPIPPSMQSPPFQSRYLHLKTKKNSPLRRRSSARQSVPLFHPFSAT